jgi:hypothetical protein
VSLLQYAWQQTKHFTVETAGNKDSLADTTAAEGTGA